MITSSPYKKNQRQKIGICRSCIRKSIYKNLSKLVLWKLNFLVSDFDFEFALTQKTLGGVKTSQIICTGLMAKKTTWFRGFFFSQSFLFFSQEETSKRFEEWMAFLASCQLAWCMLESVQDFLIKLDMKQCMHLVKICIFH